MRNVQLWHVDLIHHEPAALGALHAYVNLQVLNKYEKHPPPPIVDIRGFMYDKETFTRPGPQLRRLQ